MKFKKKSKIALSVTMGLTMAICFGATVVGAYQISPAKSVSKYNQDYISKEDSLTENIKPFTTYGMRYDREQDALYYNGQRIKGFVDIRSTNGGYSFNLGFYDSDAESSLYLKAIRNDSGKITGIENMPQWMIKDLYEDSLMTNIQYNTVDTNKIMEEAMKEVSEGLKDIEEMYSENDTSLNSKYIVYNATTYLNKGTIVATDKLDEIHITEDVQKWMKSYEGSKSAALLQYKTNENIDAWFYYDSEECMQWRMETDGLTLKLYLYDYNGSKPVKGATIIHYQVPIEYEKLEVYKNDYKLNYSVS